MAKVKEPTTKIEFPKEINTCEEGDANNVKLILGSTGVRKRWFFSVYAFGLYYNEEKAKEDLARWNTYDVDELTTNLSFYNALINGNFDKGIRMVLSRAVDGSDLQTAFEESLRPRVIHYAKEYSHGHNKKDKSTIQNAGLTSLQEFRNQFNLSKITKGSEIFFRNHGHVLYTYINGELSSSIDNHSLCSALFDVFLGPNPICINAKELYAMMVSLLIVPKTRLNAPKIERAIRSRL